MNLIKPSRKYIYIVCDGSYRKNKSHYGALILKEHQVTVFKDSFKGGDNISAELQAVCRALELTNNICKSKAVFTDVKYIFNMVYSKHRPRKYQKYWYKLNIYSNYKLVWLKNSHYNDFHNFVHLLCYSNKPVYKVLPMKELRVYYNALRNSHRRRTPKLI